MIDLKKNINLGSFYIFLYQIVNDYIYFLLFNKFNKIK
jgi:hypothetical protein